MITRPVSDLSGAKEFEALVCASPVLTPILEEWSAISLPDCWLVAGALAQTVWNVASDFDPSYGMSDIDLVYFDAKDISETTEALHAARIQHLFAKLNLKIDVKNEARVHLWYRSKFGYDIEPYTGAQQAIATFPTTATAVGVQPSGPRLAITAPFGLSDLLELIVRPNKRQITRAIYEAKTARWRSLWPRLKIVDWSGD